MAKTNFAKYKEKTLCTVKIKGEFVPPGKVIVIDSKQTADHLVKVGAIRPRGEPKKKPPEVNIDNVSLEGAKNRKQPRGEPKEKPPEISIDNVSLEGAEDKKEGGDK